jgi:hypothetical protein
MALLIHHAGTGYRDFRKYLRTHLSGLLEDTPFSPRLHIWFQNGGASSSSVEVLVAVHSEAPVSWPARSPDLNPLDFYYVGND